jgi:Protein of unknown function (DUF2911)
MMNIMIGRNLLICFGLTLISLALRAQASEPDKSPLDISYAPYNYPILKFQGKHPSAIPFARVVYSRPQKNGRALFGAEIKYNEIWRLGANESTELELFRNANIGGKAIPKGRYTLFCIPTPDKWTIILSKDNYTWGAFSYKQANDMARFSLPVTRVSSPPVEYFTMYFNESNHLVIIWDDIKVVAPIAFSSGK